MSAIPEVLGRNRVRLPRLQRSYLPVVATLTLLALMYGIGSVRHPPFSDAQVLLNFFIDNAFLLVVAVGMTFVILTGGIDLSVGAVVALATMVAAVLLNAGWPPVAVIVVVLLIGAGLGLGMGC